jgi:N-acetylmuramoyl-L-alanine amidase
MIFFLVLSPVSSIHSRAAERPVVIVIDPGHGGEGDDHSGAIYNGYKEKDLTLQLANALTAELSRYENVTVYQTRTTDKDMTLEERAAFAKSVGADLLCSIHFNASLEHLFYGSEVWTSAFGRFFQTGFDFGQIVSSEWNKLGLYQKGVKTRLGSKGRDYYGIIRQSVSRNMPAVILEHAYLDHGYDVNMIKTGGFVEKLAHADATALAKYFRLKSSELNCDYSGFSFNTIGKPAGTIHQDTTEPDMCNIKFLGYDTSNGNILVEMTTKDNQSPVIYFSYSYDGGNTFSILQMWDRSKDTQSFNIKVPSGTVNPVIVCRAYNNYELCRESMPLSVPGTFKY